MKTPPAKCFHKLDVRPLLRKGIMPFSAIREKIDQLRPNEGLKLMAPFMPLPLMEMLEGEGFKMKTDQADDGSWIVWFWRDK